jgi:branched-chain amino acid transport system ATP-binding protein
VLGARLRQRAGSLSGGEQKMLALRRAYVQEPRLILVDEASFGLAPKVVDEVFAFVRSLADKGTSLLVVDQYVTRALELASVAYVLDRGRVAFAGSAAAFRESDVFEHYFRA